MKSNELDVDELKAIRQLGELLAEYDRLKAEHDRLNAEYDRLKAVGDRLHVAHIKTAIDNLSDSLLALFLNEEVNEEAVVHTVLQGERAELEEFQSIFGYMFCNTEFAFNELKEPTVKMMRLAACKYRWSQPNHGFASWEECCISTGELIESQRRKPSGRPPKFDKDKIFERWKQIGIQAEVAREVGCTARYVSKIIAERNK